MTAMKNTWSSIMDVVMEKANQWFLDAYSLLISCLCWFTPDHCDYATKIIALFIAIVTIVFITLPRAWDFQKARWEERRKKREERNKSFE